tara:strand:+ start:11256 stop:11861 length:606 start_codon:yes stop_codon:yes gene_type:complete
MNKTLNEILIMLNLSKEVKTEEVVKLAEMKIADNETVIVADEFKEGQPVFIKSTEEDSENVALPVGEYMLENGDTLVVETEGEILSITAKKDEAQEEQPVVEDKPVEEKLAEEEVADEPKEEAPAENNQMAELEARIAKLEELLAPAKELVETEEVVVEEVVELSEEVTFSPEAATPKNNEGKFSFPKGMMGDKLNKTYSF